ncbi:serine/threonine-protein kinase [Nonomuraea aurantiaca]|uniref:serine/threonine-protein kinase n=1 Tax=Nonomuraea aurantiaca TaxID=2878562 RepID=UPI001CD9BFDD|nr:serine/threonine-protein kinase [Nonomuraea aurantiaca]MCA2229072.1 serine/threonine protein kinase [Nonomuraea aurantiaca]
MRLGNRYLLLSRIASGGMGDVWRARDELLGREVAVKVLRSHIQDDQSFRGRFRNEARITAALADPGIAQIFDYGEQRDLAYLVMELVHGEPLSAILTRNGSLMPEVTLDVVHQTAKALHAAHSAGVIHRDIKPGNLLVTPEGTIKVTDFGIARAIESAPVTLTGTVLGTAQYVSPEQAQGLPLTPSTDLYSLGVVAYECLSGRTPFQAEGPVAIALMHLNEPPSPLGVDVPAAVRELVMVLLSKDPRQRPASAMEVADRSQRLRQSLAANKSGAELSMLTDPAGFRVRQQAEGSRRQPQQEGFQEWRQGEGSVTDDLAAPTATTLRSPSPGSITGRPAGPAPARPRRRRGRLTLALFASAGCAAAVGLSAFTYMDRDAVPDPPSVADPSESVSVTPIWKPSRAKTPHTRRPPVVTGKSKRPVPSRSATVSVTAIPTRKPTPKSTPTTRTPTPTPTPRPTTTPTTPTPSASPDPGVTNPPKEET